MTDVKHAAKVQWAFLSWVAIAVIASIGALIHSTTVGAARFWVSWELAGVGSAALYSAMFYVGGFFLEPRMFHPDNISKQYWVGIIIPIMVLAVFFLGAAFGLSLCEFDCRLQVLCIALSSVFFALLDGIMFYQSTNDNVRRDFFSSLRYNDLPVVIGFCMLFLFTLVYCWWNPGPIKPELRSFIGGAIAFQMLASNTIFALIFRKPG